MPVYVYKCEEHGNFDRYRQQFNPEECCPCPDCGSACNRDYRTEGAGIIGFKSYWTEALGTDPVNITSREQEKSLCQSIGVERVS